MINFFPIKQLCPCDSSFIEIIFYSSHKTELIMSSFINNLSNDDTISLSKTMRDSTNVTASINMKTSKIHLSDSLLKLASSIEICYQCASNHCAKHFRYSNKIINSNDNTYHIPLTKESIYYNSKTNPKVGYYILYLPNNITVQIDNKHTITLPYSTLPSIHDENFIVSKLDKLLILS